MYVHVLPFSITVALIGGGFIWFVFWCKDLGKRCDKATDDADRALGGVQAVVDHLSENGPVSTGRHARRGTR
jgi:hypothetical protein